MATDVYGRRKMFSSGIVFLFLVPIGGIVLFFLYDFCANIYYQNKLDNETKEVMGAILEREGLENIDEMKEFAIKVFEEYKNIGLAKGFRFVESGPLVRSSYHAERHVGSK